MRNVQLIEGESGLAGVDAVAVPLAKGQELEGPAKELDRRLGGALARALSRGAVRGSEDEVTAFPVGAEGGPDVYVVGTGKGDAPEDVPERLRRAAGRATRAARGDRMRSLAFLLPEPAGEDPEAVQAVAEGLTLGDWSFEELRSPSPEDPRPERLERTLLQVPRANGRLEGACALGSRVADAQNFTRELVTEPGNVATPSALAARAAEVAEELGLECRIMGRAELKAEGFGALLAVARGSAEEPKFIHLEYRGADEDPWVLVGKGVTFDAGGISIKPAQGMEDMKYDMAGAGAVLGAIRAAATIGIPRHVVTLVPTTENLPSGTAVKPADVIRGLSRKSIEVVNTDAEGRLILSDALTYAGRLGPRAVVDLATLTGGCVVALGHHAAGLMSPDEELVSRIERSGRRTGERVWRLPLWEPYRRQLDSEIADIKNTGGREGSAVTAGCFLQEFVGGFPWAHLDIAGTAWADEEKGYQPKGATGFGVRLLVDWLRGAG